MSDSPTNGATPTPAAPPGAPSAAPAAAPRKAAANKVQQGGVSLNDGLRMLRSQQAPPAAPPPPQRMNPAPAPPAANDGEPGPTRKPSARTRLAEAAAAAAAGDAPAPTPAPRRAPPQAPAPQSAANDTASNDNPLDAILAAFGGQAAPEQPAAPAEPQMQPAPTNAYLAPVVLTIGGKSQEFTHDQLADFVSKGVDYTAKTQSLGEVSRHIQQQQATIAELLPVLVPEVERQLAILNGQNEQQPDWSSLAVNDPAEYVRQDALWKANQATRAQEKARLEHIRSAAAAEEARQRSAKMQQSHLELIKTVPGWDKQATRQRIQSEMMQWGKREGFPEQELNSVIEARHVRTMLKAMMFDRMVSGASTRAPVVPTVQRGNAPAVNAPAAVRDAQRRFETRSTLNNAVKFVAAQRAAQRRNGAGS